SVITVLHPYPPRSTLFPYTTLFRSVYRILQEALTNALRHGDGGTVDVRISWWPDRVTLRVDNGIPQPQPERHEGTPGHGLIGIRDRKSTRLNSSHVKISYAVFCLKK